MDRKAWCDREPSGRLVCFNPLTDGSHWRTAYWDDGVQPEIDEGPERIAAGKMDEYLELKARLTAMTTPLGRAAMPLPPDGQLPGSHGRTG